MLNTEAKLKEALKKIRTAGLLLQDCTDPSMQEVFIQEIEKGIRMIPDEVEFDGIQINFSLSDYQE